MRKKLLAIALSLTVALSMVPVSPVQAADYGAAAPGNKAYHWFYNQLTPKAKAVYDLLERKFEAGEMAGGSRGFDLIAENVATEDEVRAYLNGEYIEDNRTLFNAFADAKDAFDLEHPEAWYIDSSDLCLRVLEGADGSLKAMIGTGRTDEYYVDSALDEAAVKAKSRELEDTINSIVAGAAGKSGDFEKIREVHRRITEGISYRYETDCSRKNIFYVRTAYGIVTHEGVCEAYVRSFQMAMNALGIPCVPVHGIQASGTPETHMWCAVMLDGKWYAVDPTWDDPVVLNADGSFREGDGYGRDGSEREKYLLAGLNVVGTDWREQGVVSTGGFRFSYPQIEMFSYGAGLLEDGGLRVEYDRDVMEGSDSMVYRVSFNGDGLVNAAKKGYYFLVKMYDVNPDGSVDEFDEWYYSVHGMHVVQDHFDPDNDFQDSRNPYLGDRDKYMLYNVSNCEYVEFAVTTKAPPDWQSAEDLFYIGGYYSGDYSDIIAESGLLYNEYGGYEQPPYVTNFSPAMNETVYSGREYTIHVEFTDYLYRPTLDDESKALEDVPEEQLLDDGIRISGDDEIPEDDVLPEEQDSEDPVYYGDGADTDAAFDDAAYDGIYDDDGVRNIRYIYGMEDYYVDGSAVPYADERFDLDVSDKTNDRYLAAAEDIGLDFTGTTYSWGMLGQKPHTFEKKPQIVDLKYLCRTHGEHNGESGIVSGTEGCRIYGVEYRFTASDAWRDNSIYYEFHLDGLVGVRSNRKPVNWGWAFEAVYPFTTCPLCSPFRWNMWGQPSPLANPDGLDFDNMYVEGVGPNGDSLQSLMDQVHMDPYEMNGRIMLVMENIPNEAPKADYLADLVEKEENVPVSAIEARSIYEIDFTRVCGKTVVATGQAVRVCVGFPEGIDASMEGLVFKAYHFILDTPEHCDEGAPHDPHGHDGHIRGVEEIPCTVTQYGLVITCMSFSPFMIAAINAKEAGIEVPVDTTRTLLVNVDGHGRLLDGDESTGILVEFSKGEKHMFRIVPDEGYEFDSLAFSGYGEIDPVSGEFEIRYSDIPGNNALLEVTFVAKSVKQAEEEAGLTAVVPVIEVKADDTNRPDDGDEGNTPGQPGGEQDPGKPEEPEGPEEPESPDKPGTGSSGSSVKHTAPAHTTSGGGAATGGEANAVLAGRFGDVPETAWYYGVMADMYQRGLLYGVTDTEMRPMGTSTRAQIATVLWRAAGSPAAETEAGFSDVLPGMWHYGAVNWAAEAGVTTGSGGGGFNPDDSITREQMIVMLYRFWAWQNGGAVPLMQYYASFGDMDEVSDYANIPVGWAETSGIIKGDGGNFRPKEALTRAEMAAILSNYLTWRENGTT